MKIIKRDGREVPFDRTKIEAALAASSADVAEDALSRVELEQMAASVEKRCAAMERAVGVEEIQDMVMTEDAPYWYLTVMAAECTAKRMVPDYISAKIMKQLKGDVYTCMGCRAFLTPDTAGMNPDGSHKYYGRFNQGAVTINLVDVACSAEGNKEKFWQLMEERTELCHKALRIRHETLLGTPSDVAPILWQHGAIARLKKGETIDRLLYDNYSTISLGYPLNRMLKDEDGNIYDVVPGTFFITGLTQDSFGSLTDELAERFTALFRYPEMYLRTADRHVLCVRVGSGEPPVQIV